MDILKSQKHTSVPTMYTCQSLEPKFRIKSLLHAGAQAVLFLLVAYALTLPLMVVAFIQKLWLAILIDIVAVQSFFALNEVARDLEVGFPLFLTSC